jgi:hypothetical protein
MAARGLAVAFTTAHLDFGSIATEPFPDVAPNMVRVRSVSAP